MTLSIIARAVRTVGGADDDGRGGAARPMGDAKR
jgi:hypothetical protein